MWSTVCVYERDQSQMGGCGLWMATCGDERRVTIAAGGLRILLRRLPNTFIARTHHVASSNMKRKSLILLVIGSHAIGANGFTSPLLLRKPNNTITNTKYRQVELMSKNPEVMVSAVTKSLYPASMIGVLGELYFRTRNEMECPRGAVAGFLAQIFTILVSIPMVAIAIKAQGIHSYLEVDWLHFIESIMFWASIHVQCMSFRQAVLSVENGKSLPESVSSYVPMVRALIYIFGAILAIFLGHYLPNKTSWQHVELFGGLLNPPTPRTFPHKHLPGELSFLTWIFHWSMAIDYCVTLTQCMWKWSGEKYTNNKQWKSYTLLHLPAYATIGVVLINHLNRDQIVALKVMHPILVFVGSVATFYGSFAVSKANGWTYASFNREIQHSIIRSEPTTEKAKEYPSWDTNYSLTSIAIGSLLSYVSLFLTV